jgi:transcriptional regulator with XRE-family HTH domain
MNKLKYQILIKKWEANMKSKHQNNFLYNLRKKHNLTQSELAAKLNMSRPTYIYLEQGKRQLKLREAKILARLYNETYVALMAKYVCATPLQKPALKSPSLSNECIEILVKKTLKSVLKQLIKEL